MPRVSVVIPSWSGERRESLAALRRALAAQTLADHELIVIEGVAPQGRAINQGVAQATGEYLAILDDDSSIVDPCLLEKLIGALAADPAIGMAGASLRPPPHASWLQRRAARELPRFDVPVVERVTDSDLPCHGCAGFRRSVFLAAGGEREDLVRGLDPSLRSRLRARGYRVVLVPGAVVHHPLPATLAGLARTFFRNGKGSAWAQRTDPASVFETSERVALDGFVPRRPFAYRVARMPLRIVWALVTLRPLRALAYTAYSAGFLAALLAPAPSLRATPP